MDSPDTRDAYQRLTDEIVSVVAHPIVDATPTITDVRTAAAKARVWVVNDTPALPKGDHFTVIARLIGDGPLELERLRQIVYEIGCVAPPKALVRVEDSYIEVTWTKARLEVPEVEEPF